MRVLISRSRCHWTPPSKLAPHFCRSQIALQKRFFSAAPATSALDTAARKLRSSIQSKEAIHEIHMAADASCDEAKFLEHLRENLREADEVLEVTLLGAPISHDTPGRKIISANTPLGPGGNASVRKVSMALPTPEEIKQTLEERVAEKYRFDKPDEMIEILEKYVREKFLGNRERYIGLLAAWSPKTFGDADKEFAEVAALAEMALRTSRATLESSKTDFQFEYVRTGDDKDCLVMPPSNFALLGLKDIVKTLLKGYRVLAFVQPRFYPIYVAVQEDLAELGLPKGMLDIVPGITPEADPEVLYTVLQHVHRLQFTGSSAMFKSLVKKAFELGNLRLEHAGEVSGMNKILLDGVSASHPAVAHGVAWGAMANNGELCTSTSLLEFDPASGDTADIVKSAVEDHPFKIGKDPEDVTNNLLLKPGKSQFEVLTEVPSGGLIEWWDNKVLAIPRGASPNFPTSESLGYCVYADSVERAITEGVKGEASNIYACGVVSDTSKPCARAGTTGAKLPESVFGGMKSYTMAVAGDHDGVGTVQTLLATTRRRAVGWRDNEEQYSLYEPTEVAESLLDFLSPKDQVAFPRLVGQVLDMYAAFEPEVIGPYGGQPLVGGEGKSQLLSLRALRPTRKNLLIPQGVGLPEELVKMAILCEMSPLKEIPVAMHFFAPMKGGLLLKDPLKSFVRVAEKRLGWQVKSHSSYDDLVSGLRKEQYPPYFFCLKDRHVLPIELLMAVADQGGYVYEGLPNDAVGLFRMLSVTQAWTVACTEEQIPEGKAALEKLWQSEALRAEPLEKEIVSPRSTNRGVMDMGFDDNEDWKDLSSDSDSSDSDEEDAKKKDEKVEMTKASEKKDAEKDAEKQDDEKKETAKM